MAALAQYLTLRHGAKGRGGTVRLNLLEAGMSAL